MNFELTQNFEGGCLDLGGWHLCCREGDAGSVTASSDSTGSHIELIGRVHLSKQYNVN